VDGALVAATLLEHRLDALDERDALIRIERKGGDAYALVRLAPLLLRGSLAARGLLGGDAIHLLSAQPLGVIGSALGGFRRLLPLPLRIEAGLTLGGRRRLVLAPPLRIDFGLALRRLCHRLAAPF